MPSPAHACTRACLAAPGEEQHLGDVDAPEPGPAPSGGDQLHLPDQQPQLMLVHAPGGYQHRLPPLLQERRSQPEIPFSWSQNLQEKFEAQLRTPLPQTMSPVSLRKFTEGYFALPTALALSMAMLSLFIFVPAEYFTEVLPSLLFWPALMAVIIVIKKMFTIERLLRL